MDNFIQLKKSSTLKIGIKTDEGIDTGNYLEFDLEAVDYRLRLNECEKMYRKNWQEYQAKKLVIEKRPDKKGKYLLSYNEEEIAKAEKEYYQKTMKALDLFLGEGGTAKLLNGRKPYLRMFNDISEIIEKDILPLIEKKSKQIQDEVKKSIKEEYKNKKSDVIE
jgi:hypothetical protein